MGEGSVDVDMAGQMVQTIQAAHDETMTDEQVLDAVVSLLIEVVTIVILSNHRKAEVKSLVESLPSAADELVAWRLKKLCVNGQAPPEQGR